MFVVALGARFVQQNFLGLVYMILQKYSFSLSLLLSFLSSWGCWWDLVFFGLSLAASETCELPKFSELYRSSESEWNKFNQMLGFIDCAVQESCTCVTQKLKKAFRELWVLITYEPFDRIIPLINWWSDFQGSAQLPTEFL